MGAPSEYYVSPSAGNDTTGNGTLATPWATVQKALNTITRNTTSGDRINVQTGGTDTVGSTISVATYGTATDTAPLIIEGYTSAAGDGGIGVVSGGGSVRPWNSGSISCVVIRNMRFTSSGNNSVMTLGAKHTVENVEIDGSTSTSAYALDASGATTAVRNCHIHDFAGRGLLLGGAGSQATGNFIDASDTSGSPTYGIVGGGTVVIEFNVVKTKGGTYGISAASTVMSVSNNTLYSGAAATGAGVRCEGTIYRCVNNYFEGFSGTGGRGVLVDASKDIYIYGHNKFYNNATHESFSGDVIVNLGNNDTLSASGLNAPGSGDFTATTDLKAGGYPTTIKGTSTAQYLDVGAAQREEAAAGGGSGGGPLIGGRLVR